MEVVVDGGHVHPGLLRDAAHRRILQAVLLDAGDGRLDDFKLHIRCVGHIDSFRKLLLSPSGDIPL
jgi:hypothetical protein